MRTAWPVLTPAGFHAGHLQPAGRRSARGSGPLPYRLALLFVYFGLAKLTGGLVQEFADIGAGQWLRYFSGTAEVAGAIGLLTPWLAGLAAAGLAADMFGATIINVTVLHWYGMAVMTVLLCAVFVLLAYGRRQQIKGLWAAIRR